MFRDAGGSATSPSGGAYTANFPFGQWMRLDILMDKTAKRLWVSLNGHCIAFSSFDSINDAQLTRDWLVTFPAWQGMVWNLCEMSSWVDDNPAKDTELPVISDERNWRQWSVAPTFGAVTGSNIPSIVHVQYPAPSNATLLIKPYSLVAGLRPKRERVRWTTTASSGVSCPFSYAGVPVNYNEDGLFSVCTHIRLGNDTATVSGHNAWTMGARFSGSGNSFTIAYNNSTTPPRYEMKDAGANLLGHWLQNEIIQWVLTFEKVTTGGTTTYNCYSTIYNQAVDSTDSQFDPFCRKVVLHSSDAVPTDELTFSGTLSSTFNGDQAEMEAWEGYSRFAFAITDSWSEGALHGTAAYTVSTFDTAYRACLNEASLLNVSDNQADANAHGCMNMPQGPNYPRIALSTSWGRSGKKFSDWYLRNIDSGKLDELRGAYAVLIGGLVNDMGGAVSETTSASIASSLADSISKTAQLLLNKKGGFIWIRPNLAPFAHAANQPSPPLSDQWGYDCYLRSIGEITAALESVRATHSRGKWCVIADSGSVDFDATGKHWGDAGSVPAFVNAGPQIAALIR